MVAKTHSPMSDGGPVEIKRGDLRGLALATYVPRRNRGHRHYADAFSCALWLAKLNVSLPCGEGAGAAYSVVWGEQLAKLVPECDAIVFPPAGRTRTARGWYLARALAVQVAAKLGVPCLGCLSWAAEAAEASKSIMYQTGKGRALGKRAVCSARLDGLRVCIIDDLFTTGITSARCAEALTGAGATVAGVYCLAATEATRDRPADERARIQARAEQRRARRRRPEADG